MAPRHAKTIVNPNCPYSALIQRKLRYTGGDQIEEGRAIAQDATTKKGRLASHTDPVVFLNWLDTEEGSSIHEANNPFDKSSANTNIEAGGLSGIVGTGLPIDTPKTGLVWSNPASLAIDMYVVVHDNSPGDPDGLLEVLASPRTGEPYFGRIIDIDGDRVWFTFNSTGMYNG